MKILLIGEYSRLHNSLKKGLNLLGHQVTLVGTGDMFKKFPVDESIQTKWLTDKPIPLLFRKILLRILKKDPAQWEIGYRFKKILPKLKNYDVVQLINSHSIGTYPNFEIKLLKKIFEQNGKVFLMGCGDDYPVVKAYLEGKMRYHMLTPYLESGSKLKSDYALKYLTPPYKKLFDFVYKNAEAVIPSDMDYKIPWEGWDKVAEMIPNPIIISKEYSPIKIEGRKIRILFGVNTMNYTKKGYRFFDEALIRIEKKFPHLVEIRRTENLPFHIYVKELELCDILLDNVYAYDQGYNALEAMARGKIVFTGAETEFEQHYNLKEKVAINALPDAESIFLELEELILNPERIENIGQKAREFIEREHECEVVAKKYLSLWQQTL
ncbi:glycosyltransferase family protein [Aequorivita echinoideorum]|uniref:Glycosyltransferase n=1 Tax=Aequorivita echinoideorum TaxID=1549647 RepID=A0ABS5S6K2_9FLAO|nr:glycosyltransferase [Aequorivita echinoideorum]MBT0608839.1 glycosyltransferase [Aequorivita echinoideorum]